ncbi:hypothetical protein EVAR_48692_1, partial [Eumeta japonica]
RNGDSRVAVERVDQTLMTDSLNIHTYSNGKYGFRQVHDGHFVVLALVPHTILRGLRLGSSTSTYGRRQLTALSESPTKWFNVTPVESSLIAPAASGLEPDAFWCEGSALDHSTTAALSCY